MMRLFLLIKLDPFLISACLKESLRLMSRALQKVKDFKVWSKSSISKADEQLTDISLQEQVDQKEIENREERSRDILMQDIWALNV